MCTTPAAASSSGGVAPLAAGALTQSQASGSSGPSGPLAHSTEEEANGAQSGSASTPHNIAKTASWSCIAASGQVTPATNGIAGLSGAAAAPRGSSPPSMRAASSALGSGRSAALSAASEAATPGSVSSSTPAQGTPQARQAATPLAGAWANGIKANGLFRSPGPQLVDCVRPGHMPNGPSVWRSSSKAGGTPANGRPANGVAHAQAQPQQVELQVSPQGAVVFRPKGGAPRALRLVRGLPNLEGDNNCFLNVIIQSLWHLPSCRSALLR